MNKIRFLAICAATLILIPSFGLADDDGTDVVTLIGLDANKNPVSQAIPSATYRRTMAKSFATIQDSLLPVLNHPNPSQANGSGNIQLNSVGVNIGIGVQVGLGPLINTTLTSMFSMIFSDSTNPIFPD
jgi:hypothetical protein